jgi:hypothetical protein
MLIIQRVAESAWMPASAGMTEKRNGPKYHFGPIA